MPTLRHGCSPVNLVHIFRPPFPKNTSGWLLLPWTLLYTLDSLLLPRKHFHSYQLFYDFTLFLEHLYYHLIHLIVIKIKVLLNLLTARMLKSSKNLYLIIRKLNIQENYRKLFCTFTSKMKSIFPQDGPVYFININEIKILCLIKNIVIQQLQH